MIDLSRRHFIKQSLKFSAASAVAITTFPIINIYEDKVRPVLAEKYPESNFSSV